MTQDPLVPSSSPHARTLSVTANDSDSKSESGKVTELARKFVAHGAGASSLDLAFDIVLHDLVEQARTATRATGAAIAFTRRGELVCRAAAGENAPGLGVRLKNSFVLIGDCVREGTVQRCADTEQDPRVNPDVCRRLGVRSMLIAPIVDGQSVDGVLQLFSSSPNAFAEEVISTLPLFTRRIVETKREMDAALAIAVNAESNGNTRSETRSEQSQEAQKDEPESLFLDRTTGEGWSAILVTLVIVAAVSLGFLMGWHGRQREQRRDVGSKAPATATPSVKVSDTAQSAGTDPVAPVDTHRSTQTKEAGTAPNSALMISEDGKIIYRSPGQASNDPTRNHGAVHLTHRVGPEYPPSAREKGIQGAVVLDVQVLRTGDVGKLEVVSGDPELTQAAIQAVKQWKYEPNGAERQERVTIRFVLPDKPDN